MSKVYWIFADFIKRSSRIINALDISNTDIYGKIKKKLKK